MTKSELAKFHEMENVWQSYEWLIREKLEQLDHMTRKMVSEMTVCGAKKEWIAEYLPKQFERLKTEVVKSGERSKTSAM